MDNVFLVHGIMSALSKNDAPTVENFLEKMESYLSRLHPWGKFFYHYLRTREALLRGDIKQASFHSELSLKFGMDSGCHLTLWMCHVMKAHVMHRLGKDQEAQDHLSHALNISQHKLGEYVVLMAEALFALDRGEEASGVATLRKALAIGREGKYLDPYVDQPSAMARLCEKALEAGIEVEYVQELIRRRNLIPEKLPIHLEHWPWPLKVFTLGRFAILRDGEPLQFTRKVQQKPLSLLKALIALGGREVREEQIADLLWPESNGDVAHQSFEIALHRLRQLIGQHEAVQLREGCLTLDPKYCWIDVWAFEGFVGKVDAPWREERKGMDMAEATQLIQKAIDIYQGAFLPKETFEPWTDSLRERLRNKFLRCVEKLGHYWEKSGQWEEAVECYQRGLEVDELIEEFYQHLMVSYQKLDQPTKALSVYNRCKKSLSLGLGIEPSSKTQAIYRQLLLR
jgi:DNA-binding SARP family transcriptional activator